MVCLQIDWHREGDVEQHLFAGSRPLAAGHLVGNLIDPIHDRVRHGEARVEEGGCETQRTAVAGSGANFDIAGRVDPGRNISRGRIRRIGRKDMIKLDLNIADA